MQCSYAGYQQGGIKEPILWKAEGSYYYWYQMCNIGCKKNRLKKLITFFSNLIVRICVSVQWNTENKFPGCSTAYSTKCTPGVILEATAVSLLSFITAFPGALTHLTRDVCLHPCCCSQPHCSAGHAWCPPTLNPLIDIQIVPHSSFTFYSNAHAAA